jgi:hypothetical protein
MEETPTPAVTTRSVGTRYGIIMSVISIVFFLILTFAGVDQTQGPGRWIGLVFYLIVIFLAHKNYKEGGDGYMSFGQGMGIAFWLGLVSSVIYSIFFYVYIKFIDATFIEAIKNKSIEDMQAKGMSDEQIDQAMSIAGKFMSPEAMLIFGLVGGIIMVLICGLIISAFTQKKNPQAEI